MSVSLTTTVNLIFGSGVMDPVTGVILNDEVRVPSGYIFSTFAHGVDTDGRLFYAWDSERVWPLPVSMWVIAPCLRLRTHINLLSDNYPEPGKRPLSSTTPIIIEDENGDFYSALGGSGGSRIFPAVFQTLLNLEWGMDVSAAIEYGRMHDQLFPMVVDSDDILPPTLLDGLREMGHNISGTRAPCASSYRVTSNTGARHSRGHQPHRCGHPRRCQIEQHHLW